MKASYSNMAGTAITFIAVYLVVSALLMLSWNKGVKPALKDGAVKKINYGQALALTLFLLMIFNTTVYVNQSIGKK